MSNETGNTRWIAIKPIDGYFAVPASLAVQILEQAIVLDEEYDGSWKRTGTKLGKSQGMRVEIITEDELNVLKVRDRMLPEAA